VAAEVVICLRHGEKPVNAEDGDRPVPPDDPHGPGFDERGRENPRSLTIRGWQRAGGLAATLLCGQLAPLANGQHVTFFVPSYTDADGRDTTADHRSHQTVVALARRLGSTPTAVPKPAGADASDRPYVRLLHEAVSAADGVAVVCWQHGGLAKLAELLEATPPAGQWPDKRFDLIWLFRRAPKSGTYEFKSLEQGLLAAE
jgi:hypothetical protein